MSRFAIYRHVTGRVLLGYAEAPTEEAALNLGQHLAGDPDPDTDDLDGPLDWGDEIDAEAVT